MQVDPGIRDMWLRLLGQASRTSGVSVEKVEDGYHAVLLATDGNVSARSNPSATPHRPDDREMLERAGCWKVERTGQDLRVADGRFTQQVNPLRAVVRMVLSRSNMREAARAVRDETAEQFALHAELFRRFELRFRKFQPAVLDHYFVAYPQASCLAAGWDYWQVSGCAPAEAERTFDQAMEDFGNFLAAPSDEWLPAFLGGACEQITSGS